MDFAAIGEALAFGRVMKDTAEAADRRTDQANAIIESKNCRIDELEAEVARLRRDLMVQVARSEGMLAQARCARDALAAAVPDHALLRKTGRRYASGAEQTGFQAIFDGAFDAKAREIGLPGSPSEYRVEAI